MNHAILVLSLVATEGQSQLQANDFLNQTITYLLPLFKPSIIKLPHDSFKNQSTYLAFKSGPSALLFYRLLRGFLYPLKLKAGLAYGEGNLSDQTKHKIFDLANHSFEEVLENKNQFILYNSGYREDVFINQHLITWAKLLQDQSPMGSLVNFLYDLLFPLYHSDMMINRVEDFKGLVELLELKASFYDQEPRLEDYRHLDYQQISQPKIKDFRQLIDLKSLYMTGAYKTGYASKISRITKTSRQNIDYHLRTNWIEEERNLFLSILYQLDREEESM